jgi:hypothetical protein
MTDQSTSLVAMPGDDRDKTVAALVDTVRSGGTSSSAFPEATTSQWVQGLFQSYAGLGYHLPFEILGYIELLATWNPDFSQAVDNIRTLANSGHNLFVDADGVRAQQRIKDRLEEKARTIQMQHGGVDGLIDKLLKQASTSGAMAGEWVLSADLTDVVEFLDVNPKWIRFFWDDELDRYIPFQKVNSVQLERAKERGQEVRGSCVRLNENTFHYYAFDAAPGSPYGTPPFLAALPNIAIQRDMVANMAQIVKKVGLLGIIDLSIQRLPARGGETDAQYQNRATTFLKNYVDVVEKMVQDGGIVHFDDAEIKTTQLTGNAAGATNIFKQNEELIFSGLKSMPSVQGRSYSTTETYAGVAYDIIIRNTYKYQRAVKRMIEAGYWLMVILWGEPATNIRIDFNPNKSLHRLQDAQAFRLEVFNAVLLWAIGIIDQNGVAQMLGYQTPKVAMEEPPPSPLLGPPPTVGISAKDAPEGDGTGVPPEKMVTINGLIKQMQEVLFEAE